MPTDCKARLARIENMRKRYFHPDVSPVEMIDELRSIVGELLTDRDNLHAELIERCETMARMAREPLWLTVASGNPMIHFVADPRWIWSSVDRNNQR